MVATLPPYAAELNAVEDIRAYLKKHEIANFCAKDIGDVSDFARRRLKSMRRRPTLVRAFWKRAELALSGVDHLPGRQQKERSTVSSLMPAVQSEVGRQKGRPSTASASRRYAVGVYGGFMAVRPHRQVEGDVIESARTRRRPGTALGILAQRK